MNLPIELLQARVSCPAHLLGEPAPDDQELADILRCALTAPDHARLKPWRFIAVRGDGRHELGNVLAEAADRRDPAIDDEQRKRLQAQPLRAPLVVVLVNRLVPDHPKAPEVEQVLSAGAAGLLVELGANSLGFGAVWLSGANAYDPFVHEKLGLTAEERIAGFLYIGTPTGEPPAKRRPNLADHLQYWPPID